MKRLDPKEIEIALAGGVPEGRTKAWASGLRRRLKAKKEKEAAKDQQSNETVAPDLEPISEEQK